MGGGGFAGGVRAGSDQCHAGGVADQYQHLQHGRILEFGGWHSNKLLEANLYVDVGTLYAGNDVTFVGRVESNSLPAGWTCVAVIKEFAPGYAYLGDTRAELVGGADFAVTRYIRPGNITQ